MRPIFLSYLCVILRVLCVECLLRFFNAEDAEKDAEVAEKSFDVLEFNFIPGT